MLFGVCCFLGERSFFVGVLFCFSSGEGNNWMFHMVSFLVFVCVCPFCLFQFKVFSRGFYSLFSSVVCFAFQVLLKEKHACEGIFLLL